MIHMILKILRLRNNTYKIYLLRFSPFLPIIKGMSFGEILSLVKSVVISPEVLLIAFLLLLYVKLIMYIVHYQN